MLAFNYWAIPSGVSPPTPKSIYVFFDDPVNFTRVSYKSLGTLLVATPLKKVSPLVAINYLQILRENLELYEPLFQLLLICL